jgi:cytochrome c biogenesis protein CcdA
MWIVAVAWIYVVVLMAATEPTLTAGIMTFLAYCVLPLSILFYLTGGKRRRARRAMREARQAQDRPKDD